MLKYKIILLYLNKCINKNIINYFNKLKFSR